MKENIARLLRRTPGVVVGSIQVEPASKGGYKVQYNAAQYFGAKHLAEAYTVEVVSILPRGESLWVLLKCTPNDQPQPIVDADEGMTIGGFRIESNEDGSLKVYAVDDALMVKPNSGTSLSIYLVSTGRNPIIKSR